MTTGMGDALAGLARQRQAELDSAIAAWRAGAGVRLWCGPGCGNCCSLAVNTTLPEALAIADSLTDGQRRQVAIAVARIIAHARESSDARGFLAGYRRAVGSCPFLDAEASCSIYPVRPLACRALLATRPPDWCGVNLAELPELERNGFLASLDRSVVAFPTHYAATPQELAANFERGLVFATNRFTGFGMTGSLPLLVWLAGQDGFAGALTGGPPAIVPFLATHRIQRSYLVQINVP